MNHHNEWLFKRIRTSGIELALRVLLLVIYLCLFRQTPVIREIQQADWPLYNYSMTLKTRIPLLILNLMILTYAIILAIVSGIWTSVRHKYKILSSQESKNESKHVSVTQSLMQQQFKLFLSLSLALAFTGITTIYLKNLIGRLRPDFLSRCQPFGFDQNAPDFSLLPLIPNCDNEDIEIVLEGRRSFPSGHSSYIFCIATFTAMYMHDFVLKNATQGFRLTCSLSVFIPAIYVAASRLIDYRHHWSDIMAGIIIGTGFSVLCFLYYYPIRNKDRIQQQQQQQQLLSCCSEADLGFLQLSDERSRSYGFRDQEEDNDNPPDPIIIGSRNISVSSPSLLRQEKSSSRSLAPQIDLESP